MRWKKYAPWLALALVVIVSAFAVNENPSLWQVQYVAGPSEQIMRGELVAAEINFERPEFSGPRAAAALNESIRQQQQERFTQQTACAEQLLADAEFNGSLPPYGIYYQYNEMLYVQYAGKRYLSLNAQATESVLGEAHPLFDFRYYNFDAKSGKPLALEDVWGEGAHERAAAYIYDYIEQEGRLDECYPNLVENLLLYLSDNSWFTDGKKLYVCYNPYEIAPYVMGLLTFELPLTPP